MTMTRTIRAVLSLAAALVFASALHAGEPPGKAGAPGGGKAPPPMPVETAIAATAAVNDEVSAVGTLQANESVIVRPEIAGRVTAIKFEEGQPVNENDELFTIDAQEYRAQVAQSAATVKLNEMNYTRSKDLLDKSLISRKDYDEAAAKLEESKAKLALDQSRLDKTVIRAPFAGIVGVRNVSPGAYVRIGDDLVSLEDIDPIKVEFRIPETFARQVRTGQRVGVRVDAYPNETFSGEVYAIDTRMDAQTRTMLLRARAPNPKRNLRPGMFARVALVLATRSQALVVPEQAVVPFGNDLFVYRVVDGKAVQTRVQTGRRMEGKVEIKTGLNKDDVVITAGQMKLRDGMAVMVPGAKPPAPAQGAPQAISK
jgi:membrane fusion protein (multidrug efflux system)